MNWIKYTPLYFLISALVIIPGAYSLATFGLKPSIEFTGGTVATFSVSKAQSDSLIDNLKEFSPEIENQTENSLTLKLSEISEDNLLIKLQSVSTASGVPVLNSFELVGPVLGRETLQKTLNALFLSSLMLLAYISYAFKQFKYGISAILAMLHDTLVVLGSFSLLGRFWGIEVDLLFVTAVLTILSFSVHDTIVVYDRVRELGKKLKGIPFTTLVNRAVSETMVRSLNNSLTIIFMLIAMFLIGGDSTKNFALALLIGTITGTYSSIFTAAPLLVVWHNLFEKKK